MYRVLRFSLVLTTLVVCVLSVRAQVQHIQHTVTNGKHQMPTMAHDFWFALPLPPGDGKTYTTLYVVSGSTGKAYVQQGTDKIITLDLKPYQTATCAIPAGW